MKLKFSLLLLFTLILTQGFAQNEDKIYVVAQEMPRFPGCEDEKTRGEKQECATKALLSYVYDNLEYPEAAKRNKTEGTCVVFFVVEKDGSLSNIKVVRDIGDGAAEACIKLVEGMPKWKPGEMKYPVRVQYNLPIRFKLPTDEKK